MAKVNGRTITLAEIVKHIDTRHFKGFQNLVSLPAGQFELRSPRLPDWTRQYADVTALRIWARIQQAVIRQSAEDPRVRELALELWDLARRSPSPAATKTRLVAKVV